MISASKGKETLSEGPEDHRMMRPPQQAKSHNA